MNNGVMLVFLPSACPDRIVQQSMSRYGPRSLPLMALIAILKKNIAERGSVAPRRSYEL